MGVADYGGTASEVNEHRPQTGIDHHIGWLQVSVQHTPVAYEAESFCQMVGDGEFLREGETDAVVTRLLRVCR